MRYITPAILRVAGSGLPLASLSDLDLAGVIAQAEGDIDGFMEFREDNSLGFSPGSRTERSHWNRLSRRFYPACLPVPVQSITSYVVVVGQNGPGGVPTLVKANVDPSLVLLNNDMGYMEVTSLAVVAFGLTPVVAQLTVIEPFILATYVAGYSIPKVGLRLGSADQVTYHSFLPNWDAVIQVPAVTVNGNVLPATSYTVNADDGAIVLAASGQPADVVRATFTHTIPDTVTQACRLACIDVLSETFANRSAAGFDMLKSPAIEVRRRGTYRDSAAPAWQRLLSTYKRLYFKS